MVMKNPSQAENGKERARHLVNNILTSDSSCKRVIDKAVSVFELEKVDGKWSETSVEEAREEAQKEFGKQTC